MRDDDGLRSAITSIVEEGVDVVTLEHPRTDEVYRRSTLTVVRARTGRPLYLFAQCQDVTEQRLAELELHQSEQRFRLMVDVVRDYAIFMLDPEGRISSWNLGAQRSKGWTADEVIGQHFRIFYPPEQQKARHPEHELELTLRDGVYQEEGWRVRKDGSRFWAHVTITAIRDESGQHLGFAKITRDHTERMQMLEQQGHYAHALAEANARLEEANAGLADAAEEQARFLAVTAHELRTPVGVLTMSARLLADNLDRLEDDEREELLSSMHGQRGPAAAAARRPADDLPVAGGHARPRPAGPGPGRGAGPGPPTPPGRPPRRAHRRRHRPRGWSPGSTPTGSGRSSTTSSPTRSRTARARSG